MRMGLMQSRSHFHEVHARDRLSQTTFDKLGPAQVDFSYDPLDNLRTYSTGANGRDFTHEYDSAWRLMRIRDPGNATAYQYSYAGDAGSRGNVTTRVQAGSPISLTQNFNFDQGNRMRALTGSAAQTYTYDGLGRRTRLITYASVYRHQIYSQSGKLVYEHQFSLKLKGGQGETSYVYLGNHLVGRTEGPVGSVGTRTYLHTDGLGSPVAETDSVGNLVVDARSLHEPYGLLAYGPAAQGPGYTGHVRDVVTGLSYMQQRYYDPIAGRFLSVDPVSANPSNGSNFNRYWYANNNPYGFVDPDGRFVQLAAIAVGAAAGGLVGASISGYKSYSETGSVKFGAVASGFGQGALVGAATVLGGAGLGAMATSAGATATGVTVAQVSGGAYSAGAATFITGPAADLAKGDEMRPVGEYRKDALAAAAGGAGSTGAAKIVTSVVEKAGIQSALVAPVKIVVEEITGMGVSNQTEKTLEKID